MNTVIGDLQLYEPFLHMFINFLLLIFIQVTSYHKVNGLKDHLFIISQFL